MGLESNSLDNFNSAIDGLNNDTPEKDRGHPKNIIQAVSDIQRYYMYEKEQEKDIPSEFFTIEQILEFFKIGFKSGFWESLVFILLLPILTKIYPTFSQYFFDIQYADTTLLILNLISYLSIVGFTIWLSMLARFFEGKITQKAILSLISGRMFAFIVKGIILYFLFKFLYEYSVINPDDMYIYMQDIKDFIDFFTTNDYTYTTDSLHRYYYAFIVPSYNDLSKEMITSMLTLGLVPFLSIVLRGILTHSQRVKNQIEFEKY